MDGINVMNEALEASCSKIQISLARAHEAGKEITCLKSEAEAEKNVCSVREANMAKKHDSRKAGGGLDLPEPLGSDRDRVGRDDSSSNNFRRFPRGKFASFSLRRIKRQRGGESVSKLLISYALADRNTRSFIKIRILEG
ncbi:hypothetical protein HID58_092047 [Brassica napus]|uniref:Uncharacterized protein n=1 Tax=Brassica napus TaxID=3708 RepID=A0ABQ7WXR9_BRANA|nr:hypothetical protein HID58_092047 [Brassica napus]